jgi:hypothetical protein
MKHKNVYFDHINQKVRWTQSTTADVPVQYNYIGSMSRVEFDLLVEVLWEIFDDSDITLEEFLRYYGQIREFCDDIKRLIDK